MNDKKNDPTAMQKLTNNLLIVTSFLMVLSTLIGEPSVVSWIVAVLSVVNAYLVIRFVERGLWAMLVVVVAGVNILLTIGAVPSF